MTVAGWPGAIGAGGGREGRIAVAIWGEGLAYGYTWLGGHLMHAIHTCSC